MDHLLRDGSQEIRTMKITEQSLTSKADFQAMAVFAHAFPDENQKVYTTYKNRV
jgi:hypothetical protein